MMPIYKQRPVTFFVGDPSNPKRSDFVPSSDIRELLRNRPHDTHATMSESYNPQSTLPGPSEVERALLDRIRDVVSDIIDLDATDDNTKRVVTIVTAALDALEHNDDAAQLFLDGLFGIASAYDILRDPSMLTDDEQG